MNKAVDPHDQLALVSPFLLQTLADVANDKGISAERLCRGLGFTLDDLQDPTLRISYRQAVAMIERALTRCPSKGWAVGRQPQRAGHPGPAGPCPVLCRTLGDAFELGIRHQHTSGTIVSADIGRQGEEFFVELQCRLPYGEVQIFAAEEFFASLLIYGRALLSADFQALRVEFMHAAPAYAGLYTQLLGPNVHFGCLHARMVIEARWLQARLPNHHPVALRQALKLLELESAQVHQKMDLIQAVERALSRDLRSGSHIEQVAGT